MKKRLFRLFSLVSLTFVGASALVVAVSKGFKTISNVGTGDPFSITLDNSNAPIFDDEFNWNREGENDDVVVKDTYSLDMKYRLAKQSDDGHVLLAPHGYMYNEVDDSTFNNKISGLTSVLVNYTSASSISIRTSLTDDGKEFGAPQTLTSGVSLTLDNNPYYFIIEAGDSEATINSATFYYNCVEHTGVVLNTLSGVYTGVGNDGYTYKLTLNGSSATIDSLDKVSNDHYSGTASIVNGNKIQCTFGGGAGHYTSVVSNDHSVLTYDSKDGAAAGFAQIDFSKVYQVENFENESAIGLGYGGSGRAKDQNTLFQMSGLKSHWHSDWYNNDSSNYYPSYINDIKGDGYGWRLMGSTDYLQYTSNKGHNSSIAAAFKGNTNALRNIQMKSVLGLPSIIGRGSYLSFWAKAFSNAGLTTVASSNVSIKALCFYTQKVDKTTQGDATEKAFTIAGNSDWTRYIVELDSSKTYYSFGFNTKQSSGTAYVIVDDVEIYTADPYAEYVAPIAVTGVTVSPSALALDVGQHSTLTATVAPNDATNKNVTWSTSDDAVATVSNEGTVSAVGAGSATITATTQDGGFTSTCAVTVTAPLYAPYPEGTFMAEVSGYKLVIAIGNESNGLVAVRVSTSDAVATGISYDNTDGTFTITTTGSVGGYTVGNITGVYDYSNDELLHVNCSGQIGAAVSDVTLTRPANLYEFEGTTSQLQSQFKRRYRQSNNWNYDNSNSDRITSNTTNVASGSSALSVRPCGSSYQAYGFVLASDYASAKTVANIHFWVYNPCDYDITFRIYYYKGTGLTSNGQVGLGSADKAKAHSWTYVSRGFTSSAIYNVTISTWTEDQTSQSTTMAAKLAFDDLLLY